MMKASNHYIFVNNSKFFIKNFKKRYNYECFDIKKSKYYLKKDLKKTKYKCVFKTESKYYVIIKSGKYIKIKEKENLIESAKYHDYFKIKYWNIKPNSKLLNFPKIINKKILDKSSKKRKINNIISTNSKEKRKKKKSINSKKSKIRRTQLPSRTLWKLAKNQNFKCSICRNVPDNIDQDHILPIERFKNDDIKNRQLLCLSCHTWKSRYIDSNPRYLTFISKLQSMNLNENVFYSLLIKKIRYIHELSSSKCACKLEYISKIPESSLDLSGNNLTNNNYLTYIKSLLFC